MQPTVPASRGPATCTVGREYTEVQVHNDAPSAASFRILVNFYGRRDDRFVSNEVTTIRRVGARSTSAAARLPTPQRSGGVVCRIRAGHATQSIASTGCRVRPDPAFTRRSAGRSTTTVVALADAASRPVTDATCSSARAAIAR